MVLQMTRDQRYCSFGDGVIYEFVPNDCFEDIIDCVQCALSASLGQSERTSKCLSVPCQKWLRKDKKEGFWQISESINYQAFTKMLRSGG